MMKRTTIKPAAAVIAYPELPHEFKRRVPRREALDLMPQELIREFRAYVFDAHGGVVKIAALNPDDTALQHFASRHFGSATLEWYAAEKEDLSTVLNSYARNYRQEIEDLLTRAPQENGNIAKFIDLLIRLAFQERASDIHIEPGRYETVVRFRKDGVLHKICSLNRSAHPAAVARIKILADLKIDEYRRPQDGRIEPEDFPGTSLRVSIAPTLFGEKIAIRILDDSITSLAIRELGFTEAQEQILRRNIEKPFGMIVTSGPTGSGKTTTLYALLQLLPKAGINISTLEDPIESYLPGINQIQINTRVELTFASGLRTLLRQDPDVIMVGEIRDSETMIMAANAAMTGHLVFSTMHTNDAASAFVRFLEMKVEDFVVASMANLIVAQRLVRKVCSHCAIRERLAPHVLRKIADRKDISHLLKTEHKNVNELLETHEFHKGAGCERCFGTGYAGRIGLYELMEMNKDIHDLVLAHAPSDQIKEAAAKNGFREMIADGIDKVLAGHTTFDELLRATKNN